MTKEEMVKMIEERISTEYQKYHNTPVDFIKSAALKIVWTLEADSQLQNKVEERELEKANNRILELIQNQNNVLRQLDKNESMADFVIATETVRILLTN